MGVLIKGVFNMKRRSIVSTIDIVSDFFLSKEEMTQKKLQKMCYYAYSWYLTLFDDYLFDDGKFEAWVHGPVNPKLYDKYKIYRWRNIPKKEMPTIAARENDFLNLIYNTFSEFNGDQLESMTHSELPWIEARNGIEADMPSNNLISDITIINFYGNLMEKNQVE